MLQRTLVTLLLVSACGGNDDHPVPDGGGPDAGGAADGPTGADVAPPADAPPPDAPPPVCGNGAVEGAEECDDGNTVAGDGCSDTCANEVAPACGDGILQAGEQCDDGAMNSDVLPGACRTDCTSARCGDAVVDYGNGEECDDGNTAPGDGCSAACAIEPPATCGDGTLDLATGEECDDGNTAPGDGCSPSCQLEPVGATCGDGALQAGEACDDGNTANGDGCNPTCNLTNTTSLFAGQPGNPGFADGVGSAARFQGAGVMAVDATSIWIAEEGNRRVRRVDVATADVQTIAGNGNMAYQDDPIGANASFVGIPSIATDGLTVWVTDARRIRAISTAAPYPVTTVAGSGTAGNVDGVGVLAQLDDPRGLTYYAGLVYFVDAAASTLRSFDPTTGAVVTLAGQPYTPGTVDGFGAAARFVSPRYIASDGSGMLYIADTNGNHIRTYNTVTGYVGTFAGTGACGYADGVGPAAAIHRPRGMTSDGTSVYWVEFNAHTIRQAVVATAEVSTMIGTPLACAMTCTCAPGSAGGYLEGVGATAAMNFPYSVVFHYPSGSLFFYDSGNSVIRRIQ